MIVSIIKKDFSSSGISLHLSGNSRNPLSSYKQFFTLCSFLSWKEQFEVIIVAHNYAQTIVDVKLSSFAKFICSRRQFQKQFFMIKHKVSTVVVVVHRHSHIINSIIKRAFLPTKLSWVIRLSDSCWSFERDCFQFPRVLSKLFEVDY